jgi:PAS domain S-box-containing protein
MMMNVMPLLSWDIFINCFHRNLKLAEKETEIRKINDLAKKFNWKNDINEIIHKNSYEAIVITDNTQKIIWVNNGFTDMTGYSKKFAVNKKPSFLQGEETSKKTKAKIRKKIEAHKPFKQVIVNYKKDKTPYRCEVKIIPLFGIDTTHYIALEREVV